MKSDLRHRDDSEAHSDRLVSSEYWMEQFKAQCTERLLEKARNFAIKRARDLGWEMPGPGVYDPDELVDNIVKETLAGVISWNPKKQDFDRFLYDAIRVRVMRSARCGARTNPSMRWMRRVNRPRWQKSRRSCSRIRRRGRPWSARNRS